MQPTGSLDNVRQLSWLKRERGILKLLLHITTPKVSQVSHLARGAAVGLGDGEVGEGGLAGTDLLLVLEDDGHGLVLCALDLSLRHLSIRALNLSCTKKRDSCMSRDISNRTYLSPTAWSSRILVLNQQMRRSNLPLMTIRLLRLRLNLACAMMSRHIHLQLLSISARRWLPAGDLLSSIEVVWEVLGGAVADLPAGWQSVLAGAL